MLDVIIGGGIVDKVQSHIRTSWNMDWTFLHPSILVRRNAASSPVRHGFYSTTRT